LNRGHYWCHDYEQALKFLTGSDAQVKQAQQSRCSRQHDVDETETQQHGCFDVEW
jgi:hypothetical protein